MEFIKNAFIVLFVVFGTETLNVFAWKPIVGTTYSHVTHHHPVANIVDTSDGISTGENSVSFHGQTILGGDDGIGNAHTQLIDEPIVTIGDSGETEGRVLSGISSDYGSKLLNGILSTPSGASDQCSVDKYALENEGTIQYDTAIQKLDQFTLCAWMRFTNHKGDHSIFTYSVDGEPREIQFWIANAKGASYFSLAVHGQSLFRLNYPLKLRKWHHACASWNGKTGEWQLWVKAERVGRGFHNRIVGHVIKPNGVLYSGGPSITGAVAPGLHMEISVLQLYKVALSAGKAHRDHKHHHVHHFNHDGLVSTTQPPPTQPPIQPNFIMNPQLANGQITTRLRINLAGVQQQQQQQPEASAQPSLQIINGQTQFVNGQFSVGQRLLAQQLGGGTQLQQFPIPTSSALGASPVVFPNANNPTSSSSFVALNDPANVQYIESGDLVDDNSHLLYKRNENRRRKAKAQRIVKRQTVDNDKNKNNKKRALVQLTDGSVIDDKDLAENPFIFDGLSQFGAVDFQESLSKHASIEDEIREHDREAAEDEVRAVLEFCSSCEIEPFQGAVALAWKDAKIHIEHALKGHSLGGCGHF